MEGRAYIMGDDFTAVGPKNELDWYEGELSKHYELTISPRLGPADEDAKEVRVLNRIIRWTDDAVEYEAGPRQCERFVERREDWTRVKRSA